MLKRVRHGYWYYMIWRTPMRVVQKVMETGSPFDDRNFASGNYYADEATAQAIVDAERSKTRTLKVRQYSSKQYKKMKKSKR